MVQESLNKHILISRGLQVADLQMGSKISQSQSACFSEHCVDETRVSAGRGCPRGNIIAARKQEGSWGRAVMTTACRCTRGVGRRAC